MGIIKTTAAYDNNTKKDSYNRKKIPKSLMCFDALDSLINQKTLSVKNYLD